MHYFFFYKLTSNAISLLIFDNGPNTGSVLPPSYSVRNNGSMLLHFSAMTEVNCMRLYEPLFRLTVDHSNKCLLPAAVSVHQGARFDHAV